MATLFSDGFPITIRTDPDADERIYCDRCGGEINVGDEYYNLDGEALCDECFDTIAREWRRRHGE